MVAKSKNNQYKAIDFFLEVMGRQRLCLIN